MLIYTHCWELMNLVGSHGSSSLSFVMKAMVCHFVNDSHEVMTTLIVVLPLIVLVEISLQFHGSFICICCLDFFMKINVFSQLFMLFFKLKTWCLDSKIVEKKN